MSIMQFMDRAAPLALDPAIALLGNEEQGLAIDFTAMRGFIRDRATAANNWLGDPNAKLTYASPSAKWIWNAFGVLTSGTTLRCDHDPASLDSSVTPLNSLGIGAGAVVNKSVVLAGGTFTYAVGEVVRLTDASDISKWILGRVVSWTAGTKTLVIAGYAASAVYLSGSNWKVIVALGIRVESQRTNLLTNSEFPNGISDAPTKSNVTATAFPGLPNNTGLAFAADGAQAYAYKANTALTDGTLYTFSLFVYIDDELGPPAFAGTIGAATTDFGLIAQGVQVSMSSFVVQSLGARLYRVSAQYTASATAGGFGVVRYVTNRQRAFRVSGYQFEAGGFPSSYIPTTSAQVTRAADDLTLLASAVPYNAAAGTLSAEYCTVMDGTTSTSVALGLSDAPGGSNANFYDVISERRDGQVSASGGNPSGAGSTMTTGVFRRHAVGYDFAANTERSATDGVTTIDTTLTLTGVPTGFGRFAVGFRTRAAGTKDCWIERHVRRILYVPRQMTDAELRARTAA